MVAYLSSSFFIDIFGCSSLTGINIQGPFQVQVFLRGIYRGKFKFLTTRVILRSFALSFFHFLLHLWLEFLVLTTIIITGKMFLPAGSQVCSLQSTDSVYNKTFSLMFLVAGAYCQIIVICRIYGCFILLFAFLSTPI